MRKTYFNLRSTPQLTKLMVFQFHLLQKFSDQVVHAVFSRHGGVSSAPYDSLNVRYGIGDLHKNVDENRRVVLDALEFDTLVSADQTHSKNVKVIDSIALAEAISRKVDIFGDTDALVTGLKDVPLMVQVADCQAILMYDPVKQVVAAVHAGWKGLVKDISGEVLKVMRMEFGVDVSTVLVGIAPSLGPCCAFFSNPEDELPRDFQAFVDSKKRVDLWEYSLAQLQKHGIKKRNIELARVCTQCEVKKSFFSFRGDCGITGRFGVAIALRS